MTSDWSPYLTLDCIIRLLLFLQDKVIKFTNYFLNRRHVQQLKSASRVLSVIKTLTTNKVSPSAPWFYTRSSNLCSETVVDWLGKTQIFSQCLCDSVYYLYNISVSSAGSCHSRQPSLNLTEVPSCPGQYNSTEKCQKVWEKVLVKSYIN